MARILRTCPNCLARYPHRAQRCPGCGRRVGRPLAVQLLILVLCYPLAVLAGTVTCLLFGP